MFMCRTCLKTPADKHILELEHDIKDDNKNSLHIMAFCLDIEITEDSRITMNLCNNCYRKIISFYKFKAMSLKNDVYLRSLDLDPVMKLEDQNLSIYVDENGIKHENFLDPDEFGPSVMDESNAVLKMEADGNEDNSLKNIEGDLKTEVTLQFVELDEEPLSKVKKKKYKPVKDNSIENAPVKKKRGRPKKTQNRKEDRQVCEECGKSVRNLKAHYHLHQKGQRKTFQCKLCPKFFITQSGYHRHHKSIHLGIKFRSKSTCDICNKEVTQLKEHKMTKHNREALPFGCMSCGRRFTARSALDIHVSRHVGGYDLPYECDMCHRKFRFKTEVSYHIRKVHQNERNYQCELCPKSFFEKQRFLDHSESHSQKQLYKCDKCGLALKTRSTLWKHDIVVHRALRKFPCTLCSKRFKTNGSLVVHTRTHTKEKPYQCQYCDTRFARSHHLKRHEFTMHKKHQLKAE